MTQKVTQKMSALAGLLHTLELPQSLLVKHLKLSRSGVSRMVQSGLWPARGGAAVRTAVLGLLRAHGAKPAQLAALEPIKKLASRSGVLHGECTHAAGEAAPSIETPTKTLIDLTENRKEDAMLLQNETLSPDARAHFGLTANPFRDDVQSSADVFQTPSVRYVRAALLDAAQNSGFVAVTGESGAGKSTLAEDLEERLRPEAGKHSDVLVVRPYVLAMEANDTKGKTLKSSHIAEAIAYALDPNLTMRSSPQARFAQVHQLLIASHRAKRKILLLIEEAHCLPTATLKHLKRFLELKDGMKRLLGVALVAQPELRNLLNSHNPEVREVMQRCELLTLAPLDNELEGYLAHKFARCGLKMEGVFAPDAMDAVRARLVHLPRGGKPSDAQSQCYPLVVNNLVARAMNAAARAGWPTVDAQVVAKC